MIDVTKKYNQYVLKHDTVYIISEYMNVNISSNKKFGFKVFLEDINDTENVHINFEDGEKMIVSSKKNIKGYIDIELPSLSNCKVCTIYADVEATFVDITNFEVGTESGDINVQNINIEKGKFVSDNGDICLKITSGVYLLKMKSAYGDVIKQQIKSSEVSSKEIVCQTKFGDIIAMGM